MTNMVFWNATSQANPSLVRGHKNGSQEQQEIISQQRRVQEASCDADVRNLDLVDVIPKVDDEFMALE